MKQTSPLVASALLLAGVLSSCGSKDKAAGESATATVETTETTAPAPASAEPAAVLASEAPATTPAATFDINTVPVTDANLGTFPYLSALKGYQTKYSSDSVGFDFDRAYFFDGKNIIAVEGKMVSRTFRPVDSDKPASELMMQRNYENLIKSLGGVKVHSGIINEEAIKKLGEQEYDKHNGSVSTYRPTDTYVIRQKDKEVWIQVQPDDEKYNLDIVEKAAMPQQASVVGATELKKN
jgi:hypothetical protein